MSSLPGLMKKSPGIFEGGYNEYPRPFIMETDQQRAGSDFLQGLMKQKITSPRMKYAGATTAETTAQNGLMDILGGKAFQDPTKSLTYKGLRDTMKLDYEDSLSDLNRSTGSGGMMRSSGAARARADLSARTNANNATVLGQLFDAERNRDNEYTRMEAGMKYGGFNRELADKQAKADFDADMFDTLAPYEYQAPIAQDQENYAPWYQPQLQETPSYFEDFANVLQTLMPFVQMAFPGASGLKQPKPKSTLGSDLIGFGGSLGSAAIMAR
jgi:hypothetical protein